MSIVYTLVCDFLRCNSRKANIFFFFAFFGFISLAGYDRTQSSSVVFPDSHLQDNLEWVRTLLFEFEELHWLTRDEVRVTPENVSGHPNDIYSYRLFGKNFPEFDRTIMSLGSLELFMRGGYEDYLEFVSLQPKTDRLEWNSFLDIQRSIHTVLEHLPKLQREEVQKILQVALIISDVVKTKIAQDLVKNHGIEIREYDSACQTIMRCCPEIFPSYQKLSSWGKEVCRRICVHRFLGYIIHLEGGAELFTGLKRSKLLIEEPEIFELMVFLHQCDVAGALGHVHSLSSLAYSESSHKTIQGVREACWLLKTRDEKASFEYYLRLRADWINVDPSSPLNRVLTRVAAMLRLTRAEEGLILRKCFLSLSPQDLAAIVTAFTSAQIHSEKYMTMYIPAVLMNLMKNPVLGSEKQDRLTRSVNIGLPFIAQVLNEYHGPFPLNFDKIAAVAKEQPMQLLQKRFVIDSVGHVLINE